MKQDMNGVRTAQDLEIKYNLSGLSKATEEAIKNTQEINNINVELKNFTEQVTKDLTELQDQIDGNIMTWFESGVPTLSNYPANEWITNDDKISHLGDLYYDKNTGYAYRFTLDNEQFSWLKLSDSDIAEALAIANSAKDTADSKRRVFLQQPYPPYDTGDMWIKDKEIYICQVSKAEGESFEDKDFINNLKYTDDTVANQVGNNLTVLSGTVLEIRNDVNEYSRQLTETTSLVNEQGEKIGTLNEDFSKVNQTVNELSQQVSQIAVPVRDITGNNVIVFDNASATAISKFSIKGDISLLFGNDGQQYGEPVFFSDDLYFNDNQYFSNGVPYAEMLFPSNNLFGKNMNLVIEYAEDDIEKVALPFTYLNYISPEICDEFKIEDGKASVVRRVGINSSMEKYQLSREVVEDLGELEITLKEGSPKVYLQCFDTAIYSATYMTKNEYSEIFATKIELNTAITQTAQEINLEVSKKVDETEVVSTINQSAEQITITGNRLVVDADNFKLDTDGTATMSNAVINGGTIKLANNATITGDNGLITNLIYNGYTRGNMVTGSGDFLPLGYVGGGDTVETQRNTLNFVFNLPDNFTIKTAMVHLVHAPVTWKIEGSNINGYCRALKLYKASNPNITFDLTFYTITTSGGYQEISGAFGDSGFTGNSYSTSSTTSIDIKDSLSLTDTNQIVVMTSDSTVYQTNQDIFSRTGGVFGYLEIIGFTNFE